MQFTERGLGLGLGLVTLGGLPLVPTTMNTNNVFLFSVMTILETGS